MIPPGIVGRAFSFLCFHPRQCFSRKIKEEFCGKGTLRSANNMPGSRTSHISSDQAEW